jgi:Spy/CpxP family protein refolding chaperone
MTNPADQPDNHPAEDSAPPAKSSRRSWFARLAAVGGVGVLGLLSANAQAHGWGRDGRGDPEAMKRRMERRVSRLVEYVGGTAQQKERIVAIAAAAMAELQPLREQSRAARRRGMELLAAPVIDRRALEQVRVTQMQAADARSRRLVQAIADAAEVLTPEQRAKAAERLKQRMERGRRG